MKLLYLLFVLILSNFTINNAVHAKVYHNKRAAGINQPLGTLYSIQPFKSSNKQTKAIILLPGLNSMKLKNDLYEWGNFWNSWQKRDIKNKENYELLVFAYHGWNSLYASADILEIGIEELLKEKPQIQELYFIGYSQGGLIPRIILSKNPKIESITKKVITFATAHQGTPLLSEKLTRDIVNSQPRLIAFKNLKILNMLRNDYKFAFLEQAWTNFDKSISETNYKVPIEAVNLSIPPNKDKFIVYGSYFFPLSVRDWEDKLAIVLGEALPRMLLNRRASLKEINRLMGKKIVYSENSYLPEHFKLNDGTIIALSAIWGRLCSDGEKTPESWNKLFKTDRFCPNTSEWRIFHGLDHLAWREPIAGEKVYKDVLHSEEQPQTIHDWVINDLL